MKCDCRKLQTELANEICLDKSKPLSEELRRRASICPDCRAYYKRLRGSLLTMQAAELGENAEMPGSLWPKMASRLRVTRPQPMSRQTVDKVSRWLAGISIAVASIVLFASPMFYQFSPTQNESVQTPAVHQPSSTPYAKLPANAVPAQFQPFQSPLFFNSSAPLNPVSSEPGSSKKVPVFDFRKTVETDTLSAP